MIPDPIERIIDDVTLIGLTEPEAAVVRGEIEHRHADDAQAAFERGRRAGLYEAAKIADSVASDFCADPELPSGCQAAQTIANAVRALAAQPAPEAEQEPT